MNEKGIQKKNRNKRRSKITGINSTNELLEKREQNKDDENISYEEIKEKKNIKHKRIIFMDQKDDINSSTSKRSTENKLLLKNNLNFTKVLDRNKYEKISNLELNNDFLRNRVETYTFYKSNINKNTIEPINFNETDNNIDDENRKNNDISFNLKKNEDYENYENKGINIDEIFNLITGYDFNKLINDNYLRIFFLSSVPEDRTLSMNINRINKKENNSQNLNFKYNLEILKNNQIYFFAQVKKSFPSSNIKIYIKSFNSQYIKVGKIISNILKNNFIIYKGDKKSNYEKLLNITYDYNFFGNKIRKMTINKFENNKIQYTLCNDLPVWDYLYKTYKLNFNGRVKQTSKKNFILKYQNSKENENENVKLLQCGKIDDDCYALDFIAPLSPFEAFTISITSIIDKISCD